VKALAASVAVLLALAAAYLLLWPVPVEPVAWQAPENPGLTGPFAPDTALADARIIALGAEHGPEDIAADAGGRLYAGVESGKILRIAPGGGIDVFADVGGRPLGLEFDAAGNLIVANAEAGLQSVTPAGEVRLLTAAVDGGSPIAFADDLDIGPDGRIYFSDASTKFGAAAHGGTYAASLLDILEHGGHGRVLVYDPADDSTRVLLDGINFANGVAIGPAGQSLLINETGSYRTLRHWIGGPRSGETDVLIGNLPGFPDNINRGRDGRYWIGLISPRSPQLDALSDKPFLRKMVQRLPAALRPAAVPYSHVFAIDGDGKVVADLQDTGERVPGLTGVLETPDTLYLSSLHADRVGAIASPFAAER
jgi:sugar lactone lactonase YvrE